MSNHDDKQPDLVKHPYHPDVFRTTYRTGDGDTPIFNRPGSLDFKDKPSIIGGVEHLSRKE